MSEASITARAKAREKVERLTRTPKGDVDASGWREPLGEQGEQPGLQTGPRPVSRRQFRRGGHVSGLAGAKNAGRKPRAAGGMTANDYQNRDMKSANESREGPKHLGGMKKGGRAHKFVGGAMMGGGAGQGALAGAQGQQAPVQNAPTSRPALMGNQNMRPGMRPFKAGGKADHGGSCKCAKCMGGRVAKAAGGELKSEFNANRAMAAARGTPARGGVDYFAHAARSGTGTKTPQMPKPRAEGGAVSYGGSRPTGGRMARAKGGRTKKAMNVNIIIGQPTPKPAMPPPSAAMPPPGAGPVGMHQGMPPQMPPPGAGAPPPMGPPPMGRKSGGRAGYPIDSGAGGGEGRLEKAKAYGAKPQARKAGGRTGYPLKDGAGGGKGRLEKIAAYG
jgi:hypothetical protein